MKSQDVAEEQAQELIVRFFSLGISLYSKKQSSGADSSLGGSFARGKRREKGEGSLEEGTVTQTCMTGPSPS